MKKKKIVVIIVLLLIVMILIGFGLNLILKKEDKKKEEDLTPKIIEALNSSYLISYILNADVKVEDGYVIDTDGTYYYYVNDEILKDIKNIEDITNLIKKAYSEIYKLTYIGYLSDKEYNRYIEANGNLYVAKKENPCKDLLTFDNKGVTYQDEGENKILISWSYEKIHAEINDNKVSLLNDVFYCLD